MFIRVKKKEKGAKERGETILEADDTESLLAEVVTILYRLKTQSETSEIIYYRKPIINQWKAFPVCQEITASGMWWVKE